MSKADPGKEEEVPKVVHSDLPTVPNIRNYQLLIIHATIFPKYDFIMTL
jgi:hypothetical protein